VSRSVKAKKKSPVEQLLDIIGTWADVGEFCLTDLNITIGKDPMDVQRAAAEIMRRAKRQEEEKNKK
jgi:hypothetical protein